MIAAKKKERERKMNLELVRVGYKGAVIRIQRLRDALIILRIEDREHLVVLRLIVVAAFLNSLGDDSHNHADLRVFVIGEAVFTHMEPFQGLTFDREVICMVSTALAAEVQLAAARAEERQASRCMNEAGRANGSFVLVADRDHIRHRAKDDFASFEVALGDDNSPPILSLTNLNRKVCI